MFKQLVPANGARYFNTEVEAKLNPSAQVNLVICESDTSLIDDRSINLGKVNTLLRNADFDSSLIKFDKNYLTTSACSTQDYKHLFSIIQNLRPRVDKIYEIGCGQGEFIEYLLDAGFSAGGCDPVYRGDSGNIETSYYAHTPNSRADLYVLRCVLPHLNDPFSFLDSIFDNNKDAKILFSYPNINWILNHHSWGSITHDHVNYFTEIEFRVRYDLVQHGSDSSKEWDYCVIQKQSSEKATIRTIDLVNRVGGDLQNRFLGLQTKRDNFLEAMTQNKEKIMVWGAAGKGAVIAFNLQLCGIEPMIIDLDTNKQNKFLECSGLKVRSPYQIDFIRQRGIIVAANLNHKSWIQKHFFKSVVTLSEY